MLAAPRPEFGLHDQFVGLHDAACQGDLEAVRGGISGPLVLDDEVVFTSDSLGIDGPAGLARVLEPRPTSRHGTLVFRDGASVAVFSTAQDFSWNEDVEWTAFVEDCGAATGQAVGMCEDDPHGPLEGVDWETEIGAVPYTGADGYGTTLEQALFLDVTGNGRKDAVLAFTCSCLRAPVPGDVLVHGGARHRRASRCWCGPCSAPIPDGPSSGCDRSRCRWETTCWSWIPSPGGRRADRIRPTFR